MLGYGVTMYNKPLATIGAASYVNAPPSEIEGRMLGNYDLGAGLGSKTYTDDYMTFFRGGQVNAPRRGHAIWFLSQYRRSGLLKSDPPYQELADQLFLRDMYEKVAAAYVAAPAPASAKAVSMSRRYGVPSRSTVRSCTSTMDVS